jgi:polysaccharide biosynthesis/export protein
VVIRRENALDRRVTVVSADLTAAWAAPGSAANVALQSRDRIIVFDLAPGRDRIIQPLLDELRLQSDVTRPAEIVTVRGRVKVPGEYPLEPGMRVGDLLRAGGNLEPEAYGGTAELARYSISASGVRETSLITIDLAALRRGDIAANLQLQSYDYLLVQEAPDWGEQETITLRGEVRFPGTYPIRKGETLHEVLARAGGLTSQAFPDGSAFTRADLKILEQIQLDRLAESMRADLVALSMQAARAGQGNAGDALLAGQSLLSQLQAARATGRFVINLPELLRTEARSSSDVTLRGGDDLYIPRQRQEVTVIGEVQNSSSHLFQPKLSRSSYIEMSGGTTRRADRGQIYVVRADGRVATRVGAGGSAIRPGDTIVVPVDAERMPRLPFWQAVTQILYNVAVSVAAVNSF